MEDLFVIEGMVVKPSAELLLIKQFKDLWDTTKDKALANSRMALVYFMCSAVNNPFAEYPQEVRMQKVIESLPEGDKITKGCEKLIEDAIKKFEQLQMEGSASWQFYYSALNAAHKMIEFFDNLDMNERLRSGVPVHKPADITRALKDTREVIKTLIALKEDVKKQKLESSRTRKDRKIGHFEK